MTARCWEQRGDGVRCKTVQEGGREQQEPASLLRVIHRRKMPGKQCTIHHLGEKKPEKPVHMVENTASLLPGDTGSGSSGDGGGLQAVPSECAWVLQGSL